MQKLTLIVFGAVNTPLVNQTGESIDRLEGWLSKVTALSVD